MTYREAVARITGLRGGEMAGMRPGLERIEALLDAIGRPERAFTIAQVGGTNGKGSISAMLAAILQASGRRVGLYTSPHLRHYRERIRVDGQPISARELTALLSQIRDCENQQMLGEGPSILEGLTFFEIATAVGFLHFVQRRVEAVVIALIPQ